MTCIAKTSLVQLARDDRIHKLGRAMQDIYDFVHDGEPLKKIEAHKKTFAFITKQTIECAYFIKDYSETNHFRTSPSCVVSFTLRSTLTSCIIGS